MISSFRLHEYWILRHKGKSNLKHLLFERPLLHFVERRHSPAEWIWDEVVKGFIFQLLFWVSEFEILLLVHLLVEKHERLRSIIVRDIFRHFSNILVIVWRTAVEFVNVVVMVCCHEKGQRHTLESVFVVVNVVTSFTADCSWRVPIGDQFYYFFHALPLHALEGAAAQGTGILAFLDFHACEVFVMLI